MHSVLVSRVSLTDGFNVARKNKSNPMGCLLFLVLVLVAVSIVYPAAPIIISQLIRLELPGVTLNMSSVRQLGLREGGS